MLKLPEIKLPTFDGDIRNWQQFRDLVGDLIINNPNLRDSTKFFHLYSCLAPSIRQCLSSIPQSASNFVVAWETLSKRYDNPRLLVNAHVSELFRPPQYRVNSSYSLRALVDHVQVNVAALRALRLTVSLEDLLISQLILNCLDADTLRAWEQHAAIDSVPSLRALLEFLERRARVLDVSPSLHASDHAPSPRVGRDNFSTRACYLCSQPHALRHCPRFTSLTPAERLKQVNTFKLCRNCLYKLGSNHRCSTSVCHICKQHHQTLLHRDAHTTPPLRTQNGGDRRAHLAQASLFESQFDSVASPWPSRAVASSFTASGVATPTRCFIPTALATVFTKDDVPLQCRILLDGGSDCHLITRSYASRFMLTPSPTNISVLGLGSSSLSTSGTVNLTLRSNTSSFQTSIECLIVEQITTNLPASYIPECIDLQTLDVPLADPAFHQPGPIDLLIGAGLFFELLLPGNLTLGPHLPNLRNTLLGWIAVGNFSPLRTGDSDSQPPPLRIHCATSSTPITNNELNTLLKRFWEIEEIPRSRSASAVHPCEQFFQDTTVRDPTGRYVVSLPRILDTPPLGSSKALALKRFRSLEARLSKDKALKCEYVNFMTEYLSLNHMRLATQPPSPQTYYIPHHPVLKPTSSSTRLRVVFDASAPTSTGTTLNDTLQVGPTIQSDLISTILRFRTKDVAFVADVAKMYRQVRINEADCDSQRILWRSSPELPIEEYQLLTVITVLPPLLT